MYELFTIFIRYLLMFGTGALVAKGLVDESLTEPLIGAGMAVFAIIWMGAVRIWPKFAEWAAKRQDDPMNKIQDEQ